MDNGRMIMIIAIIMVISIVIGFFWLDSSISIRSKVASFSDGYEVGDYVEYVSGYGENNFRNHTRSTVISVTPTLVTVECISDFGYYPDLSNTSTYHRTFHPDAYFAFDIGTLVLSPNERYEYLGTENYDTDWGMLTCQVVGAVSEGRVVSSYLYLNGIMIAHRYAWGAWHTGWEYLNDTNLAGIAGNSEQVDDYLNNHFGQAGWSLRVRPLSSGMHQGLIAEH
ncbi:MAG TPA: hypothetical protein VLH13_02395 [Methanomassiliicoccales archaeon]|nr:hypothetical protein [Methanomassiliicoccales archaeon]